MGALEVKTPQAVRAQGVGEVRVEGDVDAAQCATHGTMGRGYRAYEAAKAVLPPMSPADYTAECRRIARRAGV